MDLVTATVQEALCGEVGLYQYVICISLTDCNCLAYCQKESEKYNEVLPRITCGNHCKICFGIKCIKIGSLFSDHFESIQIDTQYLWQNLTPLNVEIFYSV